MHSNGRLYSFNGFTKMEDLGNNIYWGHISIKQAKNEQNVMKKLISDLDKYKPKRESKNLEMELIIIQKVFSGREIVIKSFEGGTIPLSTKSQHIKKAGKKEEEKKRKDNLKEFSAKINKIETEGGINKVVFERYLVKCYQT